MDHDQDLHPNAEIAAIARRIDRPIVLVGMMGVGKTTVGRKLAQLLDVPFVDADEAIEQAAHMTIAEIFATYGEPYFRDGERRVIARLISDVRTGANGDTTAKVIATGGGAFVNDATRALVLEKAIGVWLDADVEVLLERVKRKNNRPLLQQGDPRETLTRLRNERQPFYAQAPIHIMSCNSPHARTALDILKEIDAWL
ncbi:MAG: shikimate kinase [Novosphingobium sp.]